MNKFGDKISLTGCKWSSLNAPGTETPSGAFRKKCRVMNGFAILRRWLRASVYV